MLSRSEAEHRNGPADLCRLLAIIREEAEVALGESEQAGVIVGVGDLVGSKGFVPELAIGVGDEIVLPLRVLASCVVRGHDDHVASVVEIGDLRLADLAALGARRWSASQKGR